MHENCHQCTHCNNKLCMHKVPIFNNLNQEDLIKISDLIQHKSYKKGEIIFNLGNKVDSIIILNNGSAKAYKYTPDGREQILYVFSEGDFFGEQYLLTNHTAEYTVEALQTVNVCMLTKEQFERLLLQHPNIGIKIIEQLGARMSRLERVMESIGVRSVDSRVCSLLLDYVKDYGNMVPEGILIQLPLSREGIANYLGIARETVSRKFGQLEMEGIIRSVSNKSILVLDVAALEDLVGISE